MFKLDNTTQYSYTIIKAKEWKTTISIFTEWVNNNEPYDFSSYLPEILLQDTDFVQIQTFKQDQVQYEQQREFEENLNIYQNINKPIKHEKTISDDNRRTINVIIEPWINSGIHYDCSSFLPNVESVNKGEIFTQKRNCKQDQNANLIYKVENTTIDTKLKNQTINEEENKQSIGTQGGNWVITGVNQRHPAYGWLITYDYEPIMEVNYRFQSSVAGQHCSLLNETKLFGSSNCYSQLIDVGGEFFDGMTCVGEVTTCK
jgi:hypothetical protein